MIQSDIKFISEQKENFFSKLFNSKKLRLEALRNEEFKALDTNLLDINNEYKTLSEKSILLLENLCLHFKVLDNCQPHRNTVVNEWMGEIDVNGHAYCNKAESFFSFFPRRYNGFGNINHLGKIIINTNELHSGLMQVITAFNVKVENGNLILQNTVKHQAITRDKEIETIGCDPFAGNESLRKEYLENRKKLFRLINQHRVKS